MKILISVILIFAFLLVGGFLHFTLVRDCVNTLYNDAFRLQNIIEKENSDDFSSSLNQLNQSWQKMRPLLCVLVNHEYIFEIDNTICEMQYLHDNDYCEYSLSLSNLKSALFCILETSKFSFENIL